LQIACPDIEQFLHSGARVEQGEQQRPIADVIPSLVRDGFEHRADFVAFQVIYGTGWSALDGYSQETLGLFHLLGIPGRKEARERMNGGQAGVTGGDAILPLRFEVIQKDQDVISPQVLEFQIDHPTAVARGEKAPEQHERIAVTQHRPETEPTCERQMLGEERAEGRCEIRRG
jgi:hypothetical protein